MAKQSDISRLESKFDEALEMIHNIDKEVVGMSLIARSMREDIQGLRDHVKIQNGRISKNERWRYVLTGGGMVIFAIIGWLSNAVLKYL